MLTLTILMVVVLSGYSVLADDAVKYHELYWDWINAETNIDFRLKHAKIMKDMMAQENQDPCTEFYKYACGRNKWPSLNDTRDALIHQLLMDPISPEDHPSEGKAKDVYQSCVNGTAGFDVPTTKKESIVYNIKRFGLSLDEIADSYEWTKMAANIARYGIMTFLNISGTDIPRIEPVIPLYPTASIKEYKEKMIERLEPLGLKPKAAKRFASQLIRIDRAIESYLKESDIRTHEDIEKAEVFKATIGDMKVAFPHFDFYLFLGTFYGKYFSDKSIVEVVAPEAFEKITEFLSDESPKNIHHYLYSRIAFVLVDSVSVHAYTETENLSQENLCMSYVKKHMYTPIASLLRKNYLGLEERKEVSDMVTAIQYEFSQMLNRSSVNNWTPKTLEGAGKKIYAVRKEIGYPFHVLISHLLHMEFEDFSPDFADSDPIAKLLKEKLQNFTSEMGVKIGAFDSIWRSNALEAAIKSHPENGGLLEIPIGVLQPPVYHEFLPQFVKYGSLGSFIANALLKIFSEENIAYTYDGKREQWWDEKESSESLEETTCANNQYKFEIGSKGLVNKVLDSLPEVGVQIAYNAFKNWRNIAMENEAFKNYEYHPYELPAYFELGLDEARLFFISYAQAQCRTGNNQELDLSKMNDFRIAFQCSGYEELRTEC